MRCIHFDRHANRLADFIENQSPHAPQFITPDGHIITLTPVSDFIIETAEVTGATTAALEEITQVVRAATPVGRAVQGGNQTQGKQPLNTAVGLDLKELEDYTKWVQEELSVLSKKNGNIYKGFEGIQEIPCKEVSVADWYEHIFDFQIKKYSYKSGKIKKGLSGFHHDYLGCLEQSGLVKFVNIKNGSHGVYEANLVINGHYFKRVKTFFPRDWSRSQVIEKIFESLENLTNTPIVQKNSRILVRGITNEGIRIESIIDPLQKK